MANDVMNGQEEIDLLKLLQALWRKAWMIVATAILGGSIFLVYTIFFVTPQYRASALLYVNNAVSIGNTKVSISSSDIYASNSLVDTFSVILKSRNTLEESIQEGQLPYSYEQLVSMVSGSAEGDTPVFKITVVDRDPEMAAHIANTVVEVIIDKISKIIEGSSVKIVDSAVPPRGAFAPSYTKNTAIGMLLGFVVAAGIIILRTLMDNTIREEDYLLENYKHIPVLSSIPNLAEGSEGGYYGYGKSYAKSYAKSSDKARNVAKQRQELELEERKKTPSVTEDESYVDTDAGESPFVFGGDSDSDKEGK